MCNNSASERENFNIINTPYSVMYKCLKSLYRYYKVTFLFLIPNFFAIINKKLIFKNLPTVSQLVKCSGKGKVFIGKDCLFGYRLGGFNKYGYIELQARYEDAVITIGDNVLFNNNIFICAANKIIIGNYSLIGQYVTIMDFEAHGTKIADRHKIGKIGSNNIGENVWIGNNVTLLKNSLIGDNSIIATGAVVAGSFPQKVIIGGVPAAIIKKIND